MLKLICAVLILTVNAIEAVKSNQVKRPRYSECPCLPSDPNANFDKKEGLYYMIYGFGFNEYNCTTMVFTNEVEGVTYRTFNADFKYNGSHLTEYGRNLKISGDRFFAYDVSNGKFQISITFYSDYEPKDGCIALICCLLFDPDKWQGLIFCRNPHPEENVIDKIIKIFRIKYQSMIPMEGDWFKIGHPDSCKYHKLVTRSHSNGQPDYQSVNVVDLKKMYN